jgi:serine/threonine-protein kinase
MSPEQLRAAKNVDARADVWGLGAVLYKLVSGRNPFVADSTAELCMKILTERPAPLDDVELPKELRNVIEQCLDKDRDHRYANVAELAEALRPWGAGESVDRVVRTLGAVVRPFHERTPSRGVDGAEGTRLATTVDPSVSDAQRPSRSWRAPVGVVLALGVLVVTVGVVTHKTAPPPPVVSEAVRTSVTPSAIATDTPAPPLELSTLATPTPSALSLPVTVATAQAVPTRTAAVGGLVRSFPTTTPTTKTPPTNPTASVTATPTASPTSNEFERFGDRK